MLREIILEFSAGNENTPDYIIEIGEQLNKLFPSYNFYRNFCNMNSENVFVSTDNTSDMLPLIDKYRKGEYNDLIQSIPEILNKSSCSVQLFGIYVKSLIEAGQPFKKTGVSMIIDDTLNSIYNLYSRTSTQIDATEDVQKN